MSVLRTGTASKIDDKNVLKIIYPKHKNKKNICGDWYDAIGICEINLNKDDPRQNEKCAFSQFKLSECDSISALIYSKTDGKNGNLGNIWKFLCGDDLRKIHLFDSDYLKKWIEIKGCEYIQCPLCKTGTEEKEHIEEHDIESMEQLKDRRSEAKKNNDLYMQFHVEHLILEKATSQNWNIAHNHNKLSFNENILREVLNHWRKKNKMETFRDRIIQSTKKCIGNDNVTILKLILCLCDYSNAIDITSRNHEILQFINTAARYASFDCISLLMKHPSKLNWGAQKRPIVLLNAVKYHPQNIQIITFIMGKLETLKIVFVCDDVFEQIVKHDLVDIARRIVNNRWHKITQNDEDLAKQINLNCNKYFQERANALNLNYNANCNDAEQDQMIDWDDDDGWNEQDDFDDDDGDNDDNDWQNATIN